MGSKARLSKYLLPIILENRSEKQHYVEPFAGECNLISEVKGKRIANDIHSELMAMWKELLKGWRPKYYSKEEYSIIKANKNLFPAHEVGWVGFNCSYGGKYFAGYAGKTKTKEGYRDYQTEALNNVLKQVKKLKGTVLKNELYYDLEIPKNSIVYCDPPYKNTTGYDFSFDHAFFWDWVKEKTLEGHLVFVSEYSAPKEFLNIWSKELNSSLSANGVFGGNKKSKEKLFIYDSLLD
jgi:DNA adenine methylase